MSRIFLSHSSDAKVSGEDRKLVVHAARNGFFYSSTAPTARSSPASNLSTSSPGRAASIPRPASRPELKNTSPTSMLYVFGL